MLPRKFYDRTLGNTVSSVSGTQEPEPLKFSLSKIFNEIGQLVGERGGGNGSKLMSCLSKKNMIIKK